MRRAGVLGLALLFGLGIAGSHRAAAWDVSAEQVRGALSSEAASI